jgi:hypothetical protein
MASWSDEIYASNADRRSSLISTAFAEAITTLTTISCPDFTYRDLKWEAGDIIRASDSLSSGSFTDRQKLEYFPQLVQLVDIGSKKVLY